MLTSAECIELIRLRSGPHGTFGVLRYDGNVSLSIECPWLDNRRSLSCIPVTRTT